MSKEEIQKPETIEKTIWEDNQRWIKLMSTQAEIHRHTRDPRLYRLSKGKNLISPLPKTDK
jgi:hypothetical protein